MMQIQNKEGKFMYKGKRIPIARIDIAKKHKFVEKERFFFSDMPRVFIVYNGLLYEYLNSYT